MGLSLHIRVVIAHADVRSLARITLTDFVDVLLVSLVILAPIDYASVATSLFAVAGVSVLITLRIGFDGFRSGRLRTISLQTLISRFGISILSYVAVGVVGAFFARGDYRDGLTLLLPLVFLLLVVAARNTWDLLVTVADKHSRTD